MGEERESSAALCAEYSKFDSYSKKNQEEYFKKGILSPIYMDIMIILSSTIKRTQNIPSYK